MAILQHELVILRYSNVNSQYDSKNDFNCLESLPCITIFRERRKRRLSISVFSGLTGLQVQGHLHSSVIGMRRLLCIK